MEHFFSPISSGHLRSDAHQSQSIGADADLDHIQTIGWDTVKLLKDILPPSPSGFGTPGFRPAPFMNLGCNEEKLAVVDYIEMTMGCYYDVRCCKNHLKLYKVYAKIQKIWKISRRILIGQNVSF